MAITEAYCHRDFFEQSGSHGLCNKTLCYASAFTDQLAPLMLLQVRSCKGVLHTDQWRRLSH